VIGAGERLLGSDQMVIDRHRAGIRANGVLWLLMDAEIVSIGRAD
jgi:hypothetical protein